MTDYVIVGAGSAGCVLAARLSEDPAAQVTLIEAGGPDSAQEIHIPVAFPQLYKSHVDWDYMTEPEPALGGRRVYLPRGKVLGGSSSINAMIYIRGHRADYDGWAANGAKGWSYNEVLPYFIKAEANERGEDQFHGRLGPLSVCEGHSRNPLMDAFVEAAVHAGYKKNPDFNGAVQDGVGSISTPSATACAAAPRRPICIPPWPGLISGWSPRRRRRESCSTASGRPASRSPSTAASRRSSPTGK